MKCRHCNKDLTHTFVDLGSAPPSNSYLKKEDLCKPEPWLPLRVLVCDDCWLVQTEDFAEAEDLFTEDYAYFSSFSTSWLAHAEEYVDIMTDRFQLNESSHVIEVASNDGYLLQYVLKRGISCLGIEPTRSTAEASREKGIPTEESFFGIEPATRLRNEGKSANLMVANNVLAHVPDINDFVSGFKILLKENGVVTFEFPHLMELIRNNQFDTIYHEHYSYLSLSSVKKIFETNGLSIFSVQKLPTHGGSLRVFAQRADTGVRNVESVRGEVLQEEEDFGLRSTSAYKGFQDKVEKVKNDLLVFLLDCRTRGKKVLAYGAAAKGNTLMNYAGIRSDLVSHVIDRNPNKQSKCMPGSRINIVGEDIIRAEKPDYVVILPWNLEKEIQKQLGYIRDWGGQFVVAIPELKVS